MVKGFFHRLKLGLARNLVLDLARHSALAAEELRGIIRAARPEEDDARDRRLESLADKLALMDAALTALTLRADQFEPAMTHHLAHLSYCLEGPVGRAAETLERVNRVADAVDALHHTVERQGTTTFSSARICYPRPHRRIRVVFMRESATSIWNMAARPMPKWSKAHSGNDNFAVIFDLGPQCI